MMKFKLATAVAGLFALAAASSASAALITFTVTGTASGTGPSGFYSNQAFTATAVADTASKAACIGVPNCNYLRNDSVSLAIAGIGTYQLTRPTLSVVNSGLNIFLLTEFVGSTLDSGRPLLILNSGPGAIPGFFATYDLVSDRLGTGAGGGIPMPVFAVPTPTAGPAAGPIMTTSGDALFIVAAPPATSTQPSTFKALLNGTSTSVPEPSTWAMMLAGFGLVGATLRRKARRARAILA